MVIALIEVIYHDGDFCPYPPALTSRLCCMDQLHWRYSRYVCRRNMVRWLCGVITVCTTLSWWQTWWQESLCQYRYHWAAVQRNVCVRNITNLTNQSPWCGGSQITPYSPYRSHSSLVNSGALGSIMRKVSLQMDAVRDCVVLIGSCWQMTVFKWVAMRVAMPVEGTAWLKKKKGRHTVRKHY